MIDKDQLFRDCLDELSKRHKRLEEIFSSLSNAAESESKSTAGDKHETGRAMIQLEQEKIGKQMKDMLDQKAQLQRIDLSITGIVKPGSLVLTDKGTFFLAAALGKVGEVMVISPVSPLGSKLQGLTRGESAIVNNNLFLVMDIK